MYVCIWFEFVFNRYLFVIKCKTLFFKLIGASLVTQMVKNLPAMQATQVQSLSWADPLEKRMATNSSILAWRISWMKSLASYSLWGRKEFDMTEQLTLLLHFSVAKFCFFQVDYEMLVIIKNILFFSLICI